MKRIKPLYLLISIFFWNYNVAGTAPQNDNTFYITQEIRFSCEDAYEVYLVWGINNWCLPEKEMLPAGSFIKDKLVYTPMQLTGKEFCAELMVKPNTLIDYVFNVTKGPRGLSTDLWDINTPPQKDYHSLALEDNIATVESKISVRPNQELSILDFSWQFLSCSAALLILFLAIKKYRFKEISANPNYTTIVIGFSSVLVFTLFLIRTTVLCQSWDLYLHPFKFVPQLFDIAFYDVIYVIAIALFFLILLNIFRKYPKIRSFVVYIFVSISLFSLVAGIINIKVIQNLGKPFSYQWLYYSDFLLSKDAKSAMSINVSSDYILKMILVCLATALSGVFLSRVIQFLILRFRLRKVLVWILVCTNFGYLIMAQIALSNSKRSYDKLANPIVAFLESVNPFNQNPGLYTMSVTDSLKFKPDAGKNPNSFAEGHSPFKKDSSKIKNVIMVVLESTAAEYYQSYGGKYSVTPEIIRNAPNSIVFENMYAHVPSTNKATVCLLASVYPWLSYTSITQEHPKVETPTISSELKKFGYRTAFFNSGDNDFQRIGEFLSQRQFDVIMDCKSFSADHKFVPKIKYGEPLEGMNDALTGDVLIDWIKKDTKNPFFAMMWTYQTHYPYYCFGNENKYERKDSLLNTYLNAISECDAIIGKLIQELKKEQLFESTLIVLVGDHGEAFGRHDQVVHARRIYEENLHIPCIFINPSFKGERNATIGGQVDIAPTLFSLLGLPASDKWQGKSLFEKNRSGRVFFFCPWSDYLFGYREGNRKYIFNANKNLTEVYDLKTDPFETRNLTSLHRNELEICHQRLAGWVQYQNKFMDKLLGKKK